MKNIKELTKIANKLDSLGLIKEADVLDTYIRKSARILPYVTSYNDYSPPGMVPDLMSKWLDYVTLDGGFLGAFAKTLPTNRLENIKTAFMEIRSILKVVRDMSKTQESRNMLTVWYGNNIEACATPSIPDACHNNITNDLLELADDIEDMSSHPRYNSEVYDPATKKSLGKLSELYEPLLAEIRSGAAAWKASFDAPDVVEKKEAPAVKTPSPAPIAQAPSAGDTSAMQKEIAYKKKPAQVMTWDKYVAKIGPKGAEIKAAWENLSSIDTSSSRRDSSFQSFKNWYLERKGGEWGGMDKDPTATLAAINNEIERVKAWGTVVDKPSTTIGAFPTGR